MNNLYTYNFTKFKLHYLKLMQRASKGTLKVFGQVRTEAQRKEQLRGLW